MLLCTSCYFISIYFNLKLKLNQKLKMSSKGKNNHDREHNSDSEKENEKEKEKENQNQVATAGLSTYNPIKWMIKWTQLFPVINMENLDYGCFLVIILFHLIALSKITDYDLMIKSISFQTMFLLPFTPFILLFRQKAEFVMKYLLTPLRRLIQTVIFASFVISQTDNDYKIALDGLFKWVKTNFETLALFQSSNNWTTGDLMVVFDILGISWALFIVHVLFNHLFEKFTRSIYKICSSNADDYPKHFGFIKLVQGQVYFVAGVISCCFWSFSAMDILNSHILKYETKSFESLSSGTSLMSSAGLIVPTYVPLAACIILVRLELWFDYILHTNPAFVKFNNQTNGYELLDYLTTIILFDTITTFHITSATLFMYSLKYFKEYTKETEETEETKVS